MNHLPKLIELCRHPSIQGRRGKWQDADTYAIESGKWVVENHHTDHHSAITRHQQGWEPIWLPPLSDPIQPERGLLGMINWNRWNMYVFPDRVCMYDHKKGNNNIEIVGPTPEIAVAKALIAQEQK